MGGWNFADVWELVAEALPDAPAQIHGERRICWAEMDRRADGVARALLDLGLKRQDKVAQYLYNVPEYMESVYAAMKAGLVPVNTNYRYLEDELVYLWDNADAVAVVFHGSFAERIERIRSRVPRVRMWLWVDDGSGGCPEWATPYEEAATSSGDRAHPPWGRSGDDLFMLYTGGTTGMPKGVMWPQHDLYIVFNLQTPIDPEEADLDAVRTRLVAPGFVGIPACPLMHGTGSFTALGVMRTGGCVVTLTSRHYDPAELLDTIQRERVNVLAIVGDPFAVPMLQALDENPGRWDISSLVSVVSSGAMWSEATKRGLLRHHPSMVLADRFSSSEALGMGESDSVGEQVVSTAKFKLGTRARVFTEDGRDVVPGSGEVGMLAVRGILPLGYYKDDEKTRAMFREVDGVRYVIPGDYARVEPDGTLTLLGRGAVCINTGGEKVFPEEVEEALKEHPSILDAGVVGVPDQKFGEAVTAVVQCRPGASVDAAELIAFTKQRLSGYKAPKHVLFAETIGRSPAGKVDYPGLKARAAEQLGLATVGAD